MERNETLATCTAPMWAWYVVFETLIMDAQSEDFPPELRAEIREALDALDMGE